MKLFVLWAVMLAVSLLVSPPVAGGFMLGSFFGIMWMCWYD